jgi:MFS family permease
LRVTFGMVVFIGYSSGNAVAGWIGPWLIPQFGWQVMFLVAGAAGLILSLVLVFALPESIPFLAATNPDAPRLRRLVRWAAPELPIGPDTRFIYRRPVSETEFSLKLLFTGIRRIATPLLWLAFFAESMTYLTLTAWIIILLERQGLAPAQASFAYSYAQLAAIAATLLLARLFDRYGVLANAATAFVSVLAIAAVGSFSGSALALISASIFAQGVASATHQSLNGMVGGFYPTVIRGNGVGIASSMGRVGAIVGPAAAGFLLMLFPAGTVLIFIALPDLVVAAACLALHAYARAGLNAAA